MRIDLALALLLGLARLDAAVVAENGFMTLGDRGADAIRGGPAPRCRFELAFKLERTTRVWAEARGLQGLRAGSNASPEVFLDETYLGPLRVEHGGDWRGSQALDLSPGAHVLSLRCASVADADDVSIQRLLVLTDQAPTPRAPRPRGRGQASKQASSVAAAPQPGAPAPGPCERLRERVDWLGGLPGGGKTLSVFSGRTVDGGSMVRLEPGEAWTLLVKVPGEAKDKALALSTGWKADAGGRLSFLFFIDAEAAELPARDALDYRPRVWEPLRFEFCGGRLSAKFARARPQPLAWDRPEAELVIGAQGLELALKPAPTPH